MSDHDREPSPILARARSIRDLLWRDDADLALVIFRARAMADGLCDMIEDEAWLWKNPAALHAVQEGIGQAAAGELVPGPDLDADQPVLEVVVSNILDSADRAYDFGELERKVQDQYGIPLPPLAVRTATWNLIEQDRAALAPGFRVIARTPRIPNALTHRTLADADAGRGLTGYASVDEMFAAIAMNLIEMDNDMEPEEPTR